MFNVKAGNYGLKRKRRSSIYLNVINLRLLVGEEAGGSIKFGHLDECVFVVLSLFSLTIGGR